MTQDAGQAAQSKSDKASQKRKAGADPEPDRVVKRPRTGKAADSDDSSSSSSSSSSGESERSAEQYSCLPDDLPDGLADYVRRRAARIAANIINPPAGTGPRAAHYARLNQRVVGFPKPDLPLGRTVPKAVKRKKLIHADAEDAATKVAAQFDLGSTGFTMKGKWATAGLASVPAPMVGRRDLQLLSQLSQLLINDQHAAGRQENARLQAAAVTRAKTKKAAAKGKKVAKEKVPKAKLTQEVEAMIVGDRILITANEKWAVEHICKTNLKTLLKNKRSGSTAAAADWWLRKERKIADLSAVFTLDNDSDLANLSPAAKAGLARLVQLETDCILFPTQTDTVKGILDVLYQITLGTTRIVRGGPPEQAAEMVNDPRYAGHIIVVDAYVGADGKPCAHAEQNILYTALLAGKATDSAVAGGKRPCTVCWLTLGLARSCGHDVNYNWHPGGYWSGTTYRGLFRVARQLGFVGRPNLEGVLVDLCSGGGLTQYVTELRPAADPTVHHNAVPDLRTAVGRKTANTDAITQSASEDLPDSPSTSQHLPADDVEFDADEANDAGSAPASQDLAWPASDAFEDDSPLEEDELDPLGLDDEDEFESEDTDARSDEDAVLEPADAEEDELLEFSDDDETTAALSNVVVHLQLLQDVVDVDPELIQLTQAPNTFGTGDEATVDLPGITGICLTATPGEQGVTIDVLGSEEVSVVAASGSNLASGSSFTRIVRFDEFVLVGPYVLSFLNVGVD